MDLTAVYTELATALETIDGLRVYPFFIDRVAPPACVLALPSTYTYDRTFGRGSDQLELEAVVLVGKADTRSAYLAVESYLAGSGASSVKAALDGGTYTACDVVVVTSASVEARELAGVGYLAAVFTVSIFGPGSA